MPNSATVLLGCLTLPDQPEHLHAVRAFAVRALATSCADADTAVLLLSDSLNLTFCSSYRFWWWRLVAEELLPFGVGGGPVFLAGAQGAAAGEVGLDGASSALASPT